MQEPRSQKSEHRNSLGYVIADRYTTGGLSPAMIVWGRRADGALVSINDAKRGGSEHLTCECGADLVARKGEINIHHFAHTTGGGKSCRQAQFSALSRFTSDALSAATGLLLPVIQGRQSTVQVHDLKEQVFAECGGLIVASGKGEKRREMAVLLTTKRGQVVPPRDDFAAQALSAIVIDLSPFKNRSDHVLADAIIRDAERRWIYNDRYAAAVKQQDHTYRAARPEPPRIAREQIRGNPQRAPLISDVEWETLSPAELRRRLFGNKYDR